MEAKCPANRDDGNSPLNRLFERKRETESEEWSRPVRKADEIGPLKSLSEKLIENDLEMVIR